MTIGNKFLLSLKQSIIKHTHNSWVFFLDLIFPISCLNCGEEGVWLCQKCLRSINLKIKQYCLNCKKENYSGEFCLDCKKLYFLDGVLIAADYEEEIIAKLIKNLKYNLIKDIAGNLADIIYIFINNLLNQLRLKNFDLSGGLNWQQFERIRDLPKIILNFKDNIIMPVPLAKRRLKYRGFNQAELLAKKLAEKLNLNINTDSLIRLKHKKPQAKLNEKDRQLNIKDCFGWRGESIKGHNILLIDDVVTTGATLNECAKVLKANGAGEVWGLVVAKG